MSEEFVALGHAGSEHYAGLDVPETWRRARGDDERRAGRDVPGHKPARHVRGDDRVRARQALPGVEVAQLYLASFRNEGAFCEALAVRIRDDVAEALELPHERVSVALEQKARGGITIVAST